MGWTQVAFDSELAAEVVPVDFAGRTFVAARVDGRFGVYDGTCPHRGAHLGYGGQVAGSTLVCPFHGHRIHLGTCIPAQFAVAEHHSLSLARGLFVLPDPAWDTGLEAYLRGLEQTHYIFEGFTIAVAVSPEYVIENVLDADHFAAVHALQRKPRLEVSVEGGGVLRVDGIFEMIRPNQWQVDAPPDVPVRTRFSARVFSPTLVASELGPAEEPNVVITAATPTSAGTSTVRVTVALPRHRSGAAPTVREVASLVSGSRTAFAQDSVVWEHLDASVVPHYTEGDRMVIAYRDFCSRFAAS